MEYVNLMLALVLVAVLWNVTVRLLAASMGDRHEQPVNPDVVIEFASRRPPVVSAPATHFPDLRRGVRAG